MGADDWDQHWDDFALSAERNPAQRYRRRMVIRLLERDGTPDRLIDIGSGQGDFLADAARRWPSCDLAGVEISARGVDVSHRKVPRGRFFVGDLLAGDDPPPDYRHWATHAVCSEVLEHVDEPARLLRNARAWLAPGCDLVITVPGGPMSAFDRHIGHRRHFSPRDLADVVQEAGLVPVQAIGAGFPVFNLYRALVIARGERLVGDAAGRGSAGVARLAMAAFRPAFALNLSRSPWGWQTVGVARVPR